ncbi:hypothetical protein B7494_g7289 [Chlorociboria aeruginascens]|nr:hypothetical protein B7494_g7289 [Chlorociboria aeruginascens]
MEPQALEAELNVDKALSKDEALQSAILAAELYMKAFNLASHEQEKARLRSKCKQLLAKAEDIKVMPNWLPTAKIKQISLKAPSSERILTRREEVILLEGSKLHGFIFPPWKSDPEDSTFREEFAGSLFYKDPLDLNLSSAQRENFAGWKRPHEAFILPLEKGGLGDDMVSMAPVNNIDLVQDITTDCSVVASLCAATARASRGHDNILASMVHPYDKIKSRPRVSENGKYIFRLHFNGCYRRVTIDDRLPTSDSPRRLHVVDRNNPTLLWPALIEKAYLKVRGGYNFPGSNSGTDLWVLTGWIPEQVFLQSDDLRDELLWRRIYKSFGFGDVMITLGTGRLTHKEEEELGLAGEHDYAVLNTKENGAQKLLLVKNPWCDGMVWKGPRPFGLGEEESNTTFSKNHQELLPSSKERSTIGTFWINFEDVIQHFESLYLNWNPGLFKTRQDHHFSWTLPLMSSPGSFTQNPQYSMGYPSGGIVWVLLSRHFASGEHDIIKDNASTLTDASNALGFISVYVYEGGRKVHLSDDAFHRGAYVDSPQTLARLELPQAIPYTVVVAQHGLPLPKYSFTLSFFSESPLTVAPTIDYLSHYTIHAGAWTANTCGGNANAPSYPVNPQFKISVPSITDITLILETGDAELAVHVKMVWSGGERVTGVTSKDIIGSSGDYRRGCALAHLSLVYPGKYTIICSTFEPEQLGKFTLRVGSQVKCEVSPILPETAGRLSLRLPIFAFRDGVDRMLAPITVSRLTRLRLVARCGSGVGRSVSVRPRPLLRLSIERGQGPNKTTLDVSADGGFSDAPTGIRTTDVDISPEMSQPTGLWVVVERLGGRGRGEFDEVGVEVLSEAPVSFGPWGTGDG